MRYHAFILFKVRSTLKPQAIIDQILRGKRLRVETGIPRVSLIVESIARQGTTGPRRKQSRAYRHILAPKTHGPSQYDEISASATQFGTDCQPIRSCTNNCDGIMHHDMTFRSPSPVRITSLVNPESDTIVGVVCRVHIRDFQYGRQTMS